MPMNAFTRPSLSTTVQFYTIWSDLLGDSINPVRPHEPRPPRQNFETHFEISQSHLQIKSAKLRFTRWAPFTVKWVPLPLGQVVQNLFTAGFDFGQPRHCQNIFQRDLYTRHNSLFISFRKMVCNVFWTASKYDIMHHFFV